jgi:hypothetical protein
MMAAGWRIAADYSVTSGNPSFRWANERRTEWPLGEVEFPQGPSGILKGRGFQSSKDAAILLTLSPGMRLFGSGPCR